LLIGENIHVYGFYLANWSRYNGFLKAISNVIRVRKMLKAEIKINIHSCFSLNQAQQAMETYLGNMTAGKVLLEPGFIN
jgi:hypothetical protein